MMQLAAVIVLALAQTPEQALAKKCDTQIPWISDGIELIRPIV